MPHRPRIAIPVPTSFDPAYNLQSWPEYAAAVERSGGEAVRVELNTTRAALRKEGFNGILLPGSGADVDPKRYGHARNPETAPADEAREQVDTALLEVVEDHGIPLLAICFGLQSLNVHRGGTLIQHLLPMPVNHRAGRPVLDAHAATIAEGSRLHSLMPTGGADATMLVNSSHHQAVGVVGAGLAVVARSSEDGVIEAMEDVSHPWLLGVQWHPERTFDHTPASRAIFADFVQAAARKAEDR